MKDHLLENHVRITNKRFHDQLEEKGEKEEYFDYKLFQEMVQKLDANKEVMQQNYNLLALIYKNIFISQISMDMTLQNSISFFMSFQMSPRNIQRRQSLIMSMDTSDSHPNQQKFAQQSMSDLKQQSINETLKELQKLQHKQSSVLARIECIDRIQKRQAALNTQKQLEQILQAERQFREIEFAGNFEKHMESLKFQITIEANVKMSPLKSDKQSENFKEKTLKFIHGQQNSVRKIYKIQGNLNYINSQLNELLIDKDQLLNNNKRKAEIKTQKSYYLFHTQEHIGVYQNIKPQVFTQIAPFIHSASNQVTPKYSNFQDQVLKNSSLPPLSKNQFKNFPQNQAQKQRLELSKEENLQIPNNRLRSYSQASADSMNQQDISDILGVKGFVKFEKVKYPKQGKILNVKQIMQERIDLQHSGSVGSIEKFRSLSAFSQQSHNKENQLTMKISQDIRQRVAPIIKENQNKAFNALQISETLQRDKGVKLKINLSRMNDNLFSLNMDQYLTRQLNIDQVQYYAKIRRIMIQFEEFQSASFSLDDLFLMEIEHLKTRGLESQKYKEIYDVIRLLAKHSDYLYEIYVSFNLRQMTKISEVNKMRLYNFQKIYQEVFGFQETPKFGKDHLMIEFYSSARICAKDFPDIINQGGIDAKIQYVKNVLAFQNVQDKYYLTFPGFLESLVRVIYAKYRLVLNEPEHLSTLLQRFFKSQSYLNARFHTSLCFKIKEGLISKDIQEVLDNYRLKLRVLFNKLIQEQIDKNASSLSFIRVLRFFTTARIFKDKINILKAGVTLKQLEQTAIPPRQKKLDNHSRLPSVTIVESNETVIKTAHNNSSIKSIKNSLHSQNSETLSVV